MDNSSTSSKAGIPYQITTNTFKTCINQARRRLKIVTSVNPEYNPDHDKHSYTYLTNATSISQDDRTWLESIYFFGFLSTTCRAMSGQIDLLVKQGTLAAKPPLLDEYYELMGVVLEYYLRILQLPSETNLPLTTNRTVLSLSDIASFHAITSEYHRQILIPYLDDNPNMNSEECLIVQRNLTRYFTALSSNLKTMKYTAPELVKLLDRTRTTGNPKGVVMEWSCNEKTFLRFELAENGRCAPISPEACKKLLTCLQPKGETEKDKENQQQNLRESIASNLCLRVKRPVYDVESAQTPAHLNASHPQLTTLAAITEVPTPEGTPTSAMKKSGQSYPSSPDTSNHVHENSSSSEAQEKKLKPTSFEGMTTSAIMLHLPDSRSDSTSASITGQSSAAAPQQQASMSTDKSTFSSTIPSQHPPKKHSNASWFTQDTFSRIRQQHTKNNPYPILDSVLQLLVVMVLPCLLLFHIIRNIKRSVLFAFSSKPRYNASAARHGRKCVDAGAFANSKVLATPKRDSSNHSTIHSQHSTSVDTDQHSVEIPSL